MELFKFDPGLVIWTWVVFGITFLILWKFAFPQILNNIKNREEVIARAVVHSSEIEKRLSEIRKEQAEMIKESRAQAGEILRQTRLQAEILRKDLLGKAEQDARDILAQTKVKIEEERASVMESVKSDIANIVCDASEKIVGRSFVSQNDREWVKELVETI